MHAGSFHTCAVRPGGELWCWGQGTSGQTADGTRANTATPRRLFAL